MCVCSSDAMRHFACSVPRSLIQAAPALPARLMVSLGSRLSHLAPGAAAGGRRSAGSAPPRRVRALGPYGCCRGSARAEPSPSPPRAPVASRRRECSRSMSGIVSSALVDETRTQTTISRWCAGATIDNGRQCMGRDPGRGRAAEEGGILARTLRPSRRHRLRARRARHLILRGGCRCR